MYKNEKIGVGIITYNRGEQFAKLCKKIQGINYIDNIVIIKHKDINYFKNDPKKFIDKKTQYYNQLTGICVGTCKNKALQLLLNKNCDHIFLIEDDVLIKKPEVFKKYIDTAKEFNIGHLNFCARWNQQLQQAERPIFTLNFLNTALYFYQNLCGMFEYFTKETLETVGLMNDKEYINALEHVEHTYRICLANLYIPKFHLFADIQNSFEYLEDGGKITTIPTNNNNYNENLIHAFNTFKNTYGIQINQLQLPNITDLQQFYAERIKLKNEMR